MRALILLALMGCGKDVDKDITKVPGTSSTTTTTTTTTAVTTSVDRYDPEHLTVVNATLSDTAWDALTHETRLFFELVMGPNCFDGPVPQVFQWHSGEVTVDDETLTEVGFRKKGLIGSMSWTRPSLKVDSDHFVDGQKFADGTERFTLNNNNQDPSRIHTCMAYNVFRAAGVPAPLCSFATVEVNGEDLGVYTNVQPIKKQFLRENFGSDDGDLYEGTGSDFNDAWVDTFDIKSDGSTLAPMQELSDVLTLPDDQLIDALEAVLDVDAFITEWAVESLIGHWDGYAAGSNNYYVYHDPSDGLLRFIPWGAEAVFEDGAADPVYAYSVLVMRLYNHPDTHARYQVESQRLLDEVWDEVWLQSEVDRMDALISPHLLDPAVTAEAIDTVRAFVDTRRDTIQGAIDLPPDRPEYDKPKSCIDPIGQVNASFSTVWGSMDDDPFQYDAQLQGDMFGAPLIDFLVGAIAGYDEEGVSYIALLAINNSFDTITYAAVDIPDDLTPGTYPVDIAAVPGFVFNLDITDPLAEPDPLTFVGGELVITEMSYQDGGVVAGSFSGILLPNIFE